MSISVILLISLLIAFLFVFAFNSWRKEDDDMALTVRDDLDKKYEEYTIRKYSPD